MNPNSGIPTTRIPKQATQKILSQPQVRKLLQEGKAKAIGVCNYSMRHLKELFETCEVRPMVNQVEFHPLLVQAELLEFCEREGLAFQAFASLGSGDSRRARDFFALSGVQAAARAHGATPAAVLLRWATQKGCHIIPKSSDPGRMKQNAAIFGLHLTDEELRAIDAANVNARLTWGGTDPDRIG